MNIPGQPLTGALLLSALAGASLAAEVRLETRLVPDADIRTGQSISFEIDVMTDTWLTDTPVFGPLEAAGTLVSFEGSQGRTIQRTIDGKRYFGVTYSYRLTPLASGVTTLPAFRILAAVGQEEEHVAVTVPERSFAVQSLPAAEAADIKLLAADVRLDQNLSTPGPFTAGYPLIREIRVEARRALPLSIPSLASSSAVGMPGTPLPAEIHPLTDDAGSTTGGERIERIRYTPDHAGSYELPALSITWWDIDDNRVRQSTLPPLPIEIMPGFTPSQHRISRGWLAFLLAAGTGIALVAVCRWTITSHLRGVMNMIRNRWQNSLPGRRRAAIRQLRNTSRELTGVYRLTCNSKGAHSLNDSPLPPHQKKAFLAGIAGYYSIHPQPDSSTRQLIPLIRGIKGNSGPDRTRRLSHLPPLNPDQEQKSPDLRVRAKGGAQQQEVFRDY